MPFGHEWLAAIKRAIATWDPAKHPRGRDGKFIEVGDLVKIFSGPNSPQTDSGVVVAGHLYEDGRFFVAVKSSTDGKVHWYRPKQIEAMHPKADLKPKMPIPDIGNKEAESVPWQNNDLSSLKQDVEQKLETIDKKGTLGLPPTGLSKSQTAGQFSTEYTWQGAKQNPADAMAAEVAKADLVKEGSFDKGAAAVSTWMAPHIVDKPPAIDPIVLNGGQWHALWDYLANNHEQNAEFGGVPIDPGFGFSKNGVDLVVYEPHSAVDSMQAAIDLNQEFGSEADADHIKEVLDKVSKEVAKLPPPSANEHNAADDELLAKINAEIGGEVLTPVAPAPDLLDKTTKITPPVSELPPTEFGDMLYVHPAGKKIVVHPGGDYTVYNKDNKKIGKSSTSATPEKLMEGHGAWKHVPVEPQGGFFKTTPVPDEESYVPTGADQGPMDWEKELLQNAGFDLPPKMPDWMYGPSWHQLDPEEKKKVAAAPPLPDDLSPAQYLEQIKAGKVAPDTWGVGSTGYYMVGGQKEPITVVGKFADGKVNVQFADGSAYTASPSDLSKIPPDSPVLDEPTAPAPASPAGPPPIKLPAGKTAEQVIHEGIVTSAMNKNLGTAEVYSNLDAALNAPDYEEGLKHLSVAMTLAKLGGKQRTRYKTLLAMHHGVNPVAPQKVPDKPAPSKPGALKPILPSAPAGGNVPTMEQAATWVKGSHNAGTTKAQIQQNLADRLTHVDAQDWYNILYDSPGMNSNKSADAMHDLHVSGKTNIPNAVLWKGSDGEWQVKSSGIPGGVQMPVNPENIKKALRETAVKALIATWAATSNDNNARSLVLQEAAHLEFGLPDDWIYKWHNSPTGIPAHRTKHMSTYRQFLRAMYDNTQVELKKKGWTHVRLRRGVTAPPSLKNPTPTKTVLVGKGNKGSIIQRPMSSFSPTQSTAGGFGSYVQDAYVPIDRIIGSALTGFGCQNETEFVVLGGENIVTVYT